jgi:hypothetical protein
MRATFAILSDFVDFLLAIWREWKTLLTGGTIIAGLSIFHAVSHRPVSRDLTWITLGVTLLLAIFFSWRKQWARNESRFIKASPRQLMELRNGHPTEMHARAYIKQYIGRRIKTRAEVREVMGAWFLSLVFLTAEDGTNLTAVVSPFRRHDFAYFAQENAVLTVSGRLLSIDYSSLELLALEVLEIERAAKDD